jgi:hypothetical protein
VLAATWLEWCAVRRVLATRRGTRVDLVRCGVALRRWTPPAGHRAALVTCGIAGGLVADLPPGTVVIAESVALEGGEPVACDQGWVRALVAGAREMGHQPAVGPLLTARRPVVGAARHAWAQRGFLAVEMETALLAPIGAPLASLRVILDAPSREMSPGWAAPARAALDPRRWGEMVWLASRAPSYARRAALCLATGLEHATPGRR